MFNESLFSSKTDEWSTPKQFFNEIVYKYGEFDLDPCCTADSAKAKKFYTKQDDGLSKEWMGKVWMNPPYGKYIKDWMRKAYESSLNGAVVFCLVPARTDTEWWHKYAMKGDIIFIKGRLKFGGSKTPAPFPSVLVIFNYQ